MHDSSPPRLQVEPSQAVRSSARRRGYLIGVVAASVVTTIAGLVAPSRAAEVLPEVVVTGSRSAEPAENVSTTARVFDAAEVRETPTLTLDETLRSAPGFSLFRRTDSLIANPTAQGVSLRGIGPSGASRSLVLLDGVPLNDPFGGWVAWSKLPRSAISRVEIVPGGGATPWGNAALGGVIQLFSAPLLSTPAPHGAFSLLVGDDRTRAASVVATTPAAAGALQVAAESFATDGFSLVAPERRGPIDTAAWSRHRSVSARLREPLGALQVTATLRGFDETRGNGTPYQQNHSRETFASLELKSAAAATLNWTAEAYGQDQGFGSTFSSVNAARTAETPASDQFAVPATAWGAAWTGVWTDEAGAQATFGLDGRAVTGETRENYSFSKGTYTRQRIAGGSQAIGGAFARYQKPLGAHWHLNLGARFDDWAESQGHRFETDRATGATLRADRYANRSGGDVSPSAGVVWSDPNGWRLRANAQRAFRRPTLNELYRPFRQGANVVEANPDLKTEHATSVEAGIDRLWYRAGPASSGADATPQHEPWLQLSATAFRTELRDAVSNVTLARGPGTFPLFGTLPAGGTGRERLNLDEVVVQGFETSFTWTAARSLRFTANYIYEDATVRKASIAPTLLGKTLAEVPWHGATLRANWTAPGGIVVTPRLRWIGRQFDDDENTLRLGEAVVVDLGVSHALGHGLEVFVDAENVTNARVETARSTDGVVNVGTPRLVFAGIRGRW
jgi:outer membrane receptor protein involved in Fe transport